MSEGSSFSQFDRLNNHFDLWPYINDSQSLLDTLYNIKPSDLNLPKLKDDKLGPKNLLEMIKDKHINGTRYNADAKKLDPIPDTPISGDNLIYFSQYAVKWSLLNYIRCFNPSYIFINQEKLLADFMVFSFSFEYDLTNFNGSVEETKILLSKLVSMIESKTKQQIA